MKDFLSDVLPDEFFRCVNGSICNSISELADCIENLTDSDFFYHKKSRQDDFAKWIRESVGWKILADRLEGVFEKKEYALVIRKFIRKKPMIDLKFLEDKILHYVHPLLRIAILVLCIFILLNVTGLTKEMANNHISDLAVQKKIDIINEKMDSLENVLQSGEKNPYTPYYDNNLKQENVSFPRDILRYDEMSIKNSSIFLGINSTVQNLRIGLVGNTSSMVPVLNENSNTIQIAPLSEKEIEIGDIISYEYEDNIILHRIIELGTDKNGWWARAKGDNNIFPDSDIVRFSQIRGMVIGVIY